jgi:hypothetical protein
MLKSTYGGNKRIHKKRPGLVWSTMQYDKLSEESIVEAVLNYGNFKRRE